jgi:hypothetical protein
MLPGITPALFAKRVTPISIFNIDVSFGAGSITVPAGGVPAGSFIGVVTSEGQQISWTTGGSVSDPRGNTYTQLTHQNIDTGSKGFLTFQYAKNCNALLAGDTIVVARQDIAAGACYSGFYATGVHLTSPIDPAVTALTSGKSASPTITSGVPAFAGDYMVNCMALQITTIPTVTQDPAGWAAPPTAARGSSAGVNLTEIIGGSKLNPGMGALTYTPTLSLSLSYAAIVLGLRPAP